MKTLTIHDVKPEFNGIDLHKYKLTFDDGLFSQYFYWDIFKLFPNKIFFISTNLIDIGLGKREKWKGKMKTFPDCFESLYNYRETGNKENYMRIEELREIINDGAIIGAHGHNHIKCYLHENQIRRDIDSMLEWFEKYLKIKPTKYSYPHYEDSLILTRILKNEYGFTEFYGKERIEIEQEKKLIGGLI